MGEPVRRDSRKKVRGESGYGQGDGFAADVLLIADPEDDRPLNGRNGAHGSAPAEPLDMENVVRKLIALLSEQQQP